MNLLNGYYLSSPLLEGNTDDQHQPFPTGFNSEKLKSTTDVLPNIDSKSPKVKSNLQTKQNFINAISELSKTKNYTHVQSFVKQVPTMIETI